MGQTTLFHGSTARQGAPVVQRQSVHLACASLETRSVETHLGRCRVEVPLECEALLIPKTIPHILPKLHPMSLVPVILTSLVLSWLIPSQLSVAFPSRRYRCQLFPIRTDTAQSVLMKPSLKLIL